MEEGTRRSIFLGLGAVALIALLVAGVTVVLAPQGTGMILLAAVCVLILVVAAEVVLWIVDRPRAG